MNAQRIESVAKTKKILEEAFDAETIRHERALERIKKNTINNQNECTHPFEMSFSEGNICSVCGKDYPPY